MSTGEVNVEAKTDVTLYEDATVSVTACPYRKEAVIHVETMNVRITCGANLDAVRNLKHMFVDTEDVMLGWHKKPTEATTD